MNDYWVFHQLCGQVESRFGGFRGLRLDQLDHSVIAQSDNLLDFGSGDADNSGLCKSYWRLEPDERYQAELRSHHDLVNHIDKFDAVYANQVFEHVLKDEIDDVIECISTAMNKSGKILATIPNVCNWTKYICDYDHKNPLSFYHLGALFEKHGITAIDAYRYTKRKHEIDNAHPDEKMVLNVLMKFFELDPANFVAVVGEKR